MKQKTSRALNAIVTSACLISLWTIISLWYVYAAPGSSTQQVASSESQENLDAANVLYQKGITSVAPVDTAFYENLTRKSAGLLLTRFADTIVKTPVQQETCAFNDLWALAPVDRDGILRSCQLGIFKWTAGAYMPNDLFTRGQLVTVIARLLSKNSNMEKDAAYDYLLHLGMVTVDDRAHAMTPALRKDLYIILHRIIVAISQATTFAPFTDTFTVGNTVGSSSMPSPLTVNHETQVLKIIAYKKSSVYGNYQAVQQGSAVVVGKGKIITNAHVVLEDDENPFVLFEICKTIAGVSKPECFTTAQLEYYDTDTDLALLRIVDTKWLPTPVTLAATQPRNGDELHVWWYPGIGGSSITYTKWVVSGIEKGKIKSDVKIDHGNSGGGAFNKKGELIGIPNSAQVDTDTLAYIIPYDSVKAFLGKQWDISTYTGSTDTAFVTYTRTIQGQKKSNTITTPYFSLPTLNAPAFGNITLDTMSTDPSRGLYSISLSTDNNTSQITISSIQDNSIAANTGEDNDLLARLEEACGTLTSGNVELGNATREMIRCQNIFGETNLIQQYMTSAASGSAVTIQLQSDSSSAAVDASLHALLDTINIPTPPKTPLTHSLYTAWPITFAPQANLHVTQSIDPMGDIAHTIKLIYPNIDVDVGLSIDTITPATMKMLAKSKDSYLTLNTDYISRRSEYYDMILSGTLVQTQAGFTVYVAAWKDKAEDVEAGDKPTRTIYFTTNTTTGPDQNYDITLRISYDGDQNSTIEQGILQLLSKIAITGTMPFTDLGGTPVPLTSVVIKQ